MIDLFFWRFFFFWGVGGDLGGSWRDFCMGDMC